MTEAWDDLANFLAQRSRCAADVAFITSDCARDHPQYKHVLECRECYEKVIDRMRSRYLDPKDGVAGEWFTGRDAFLRDLDAVFGYVRQYKAPLTDVDARLEEERRRWYEQRVRDSPSIRKSLDELMGKKDVLAKVGTNGVRFEDVVAEIREALEDSDITNREHGAQDIERTLERLMGARTAEERTQVYKDTFFQSKPDEPASTKMQVYLSRLQSGAAMDEIINNISVDRRSSIGAMDQKEKHKQRVNELRRAKNAHELEKTKKARQDSNTRPHPPEEMYDQPPCHACGRELDLQDYSACPLCQVLVDKGVRHKPTVFCSEACVYGPYGQDAHMEDAHDCAGGDNCPQMVDEDVDMDMHAEGPFLCGECTNGAKRETIYCSLRCAAMNFQSHREGVHVPERRMRGLDVDRGLHDEVIFDREDRTRYHAREIKVHMVALDDLLIDFQQRNALEAINNGYHE